MLSSFMCRNVFLLHSHLKADLAGYEFQIVFLITLPVRYCLLASVLLMKSLILPLCDLCIFVGIHFFPLGVFRDFLKFQQDVTIHLPFLHLLILFQAANYSCLPLSPPENFQNSYNTDVGLSGSVFYISTFLSYSRGILGEFLSFVFHLFFLCPFCY